MLDEVEGRGACHQDFSHMADVEEPRALSNSVVLIQNPRILYRHVESSEGNHFGAKGDMTIIQRRALEVGGIRHGRLG